MDFYRIKTRTKQKGSVEIYPDFIVKRSNDLMVRGKAFYAIWDEEARRWSTDEYDVQRLVDAELFAHAEELKNRLVDHSVSVKTMQDFSTGSWAEFRKYMQYVSDSSNQLDTSLTFANTKVRKKDYVSKHLPYDLQEGSIDAYDEIIGTLYTPSERAKLEWAIGAIVSGDAKTIQKFIVLYGEQGAGKSTILNIIQQLFIGYYTVFEAQALTSSNNQFATETFKANPLVAIQHDGDLSKIEDNSKLNSIVSHEEMTMNEKYKPSYASKVNCFLFMATNKPVKITDSKSGIIRRLIDVKPSGNKIPVKHYSILINQVEFELGAIAQHCLNVYRDMGKNYYSNYVPFSMIFETDVFFNFVEDQYYVFKSLEGVSLKQAYDMYKEYCDDSSIQYKLPRYKFRAELKSYFSEFEDRKKVDGRDVRSFYSGFKTDKFEVSDNEDPVDEEVPSALILDKNESILDIACSDCKAQYATHKETPYKKWMEVTTKLSDLDTAKLHYLRLPKDHIVIDFDLKDDTGTKSMELNLDAAAKWPPTYAEYSKSGGGIHLHYLYEGDVTRLANIYDTDIEIKTFTGRSSLRRKLTKCNGIPVATIQSGLPLKGEKVINFDAVSTEQGVRRMIEKNLNREVWDSTKSSIDFIYKILDDAYTSGIKYDVTDMRQRVLVFANNSTNQSQNCLQAVSKMQFKSEEVEISNKDADGDIAFFDVEVFPNLFVVVWKYPGGTPVQMINPSPADIEQLLKLKLVGFNNRRYDNHILYARYIGYDNAGLYNLSQKIINNSKNATFAEAYGLSYTDIYEFSSKKQSLKKFEIELGIHHQELGLPWDEPVDPSLWEKVAEYCINDVVATEETFNARHGDFVARQILADLSELSVNDTTQKHAARIIFGKNREPQKEFVYTDLSEMFPGYEYSFGKSTYRGETVGEGGYVYSEPGMYGNVALLDVVSMHPNSLINLNHFGPYTQNFKDVVLARVAIKESRYDDARAMLNGQLVKYLVGAEEDPNIAGDLGYALKIVINIIYGMTSAKFENPFKDPRNDDNIVAKRGALFMIDLKHAVQELGFTVAHIKTDSIKIPDATPEIIKFVQDFGRGYGYEFEHEASYEKICLVNDAVYIAKYSMVDGIPFDEYSDNTFKKKGYRPLIWTPTGAQFAQPYVFKSLFSQEPILFEDMCETKSVTTALYLDMNESIMPEDYLKLEKELLKLNKALEKSYYQPEESKNYIPEPERNSMEDRIKDLRGILDAAHDYHFVGKVGSFCPIKPGHNGGVLLREKDGRFSAATGSKGYRWLEAEMVQTLGKEKSIDKRFYIEMADKAVDAINNYGDFDWFVSDEPYTEDAKGVHILPF